MKAGEWSYSLPILHLDGVLFFYVLQYRESIDKPSVINDPLGQTSNPACNDHYSHLKIVLRYFWKWEQMDGLMDGQQVWK